MKVHFQKYGFVHAFWLITILIMIIAGLLLRAPSGDKIGDYIAFAASIASLVLAIVVIFYSMISNQGFSETVGSLKTLATTVHESANDIKLVSSDFVDKASEIFGELSEIRPEVRAISEK